MKEFKIRLEKDKYLLKKFCELIFLHFSILFKILGKYTKDDEINMKLVLVLFSIKKRGLNEK